MSQDNNSNEDSKPVTVIVRRIAKKDKIKKFEEWLSGISKEVSLLLCLSWQDGIIFLPCNEQLKTSGVSD